MLRPQKKLALMPELARAPAFFLWGLSTGGVEVRSVQASTQNAFSFDWRCHDYHRKTKVTWSIFLFLSIFH